MKTNYNDDKFSRDFKLLTLSILRKLSKAESREEAQEGLQMLEKLASYPNSPATAKTLLGVAYLMEDKPWYDFEKGFEAVKKGAEEAKENESFCWLKIGVLYLQERKDIPTDLISAKYWIEKAATAGNEEAREIKELYWGNNPPDTPVNLIEHLIKFRRRKKYLMYLDLYIMIPVIIGFLLYLALTR